MKSFVACALTLVILVASVLLIEPLPAFACTQPPGGHPQYSVAERTQSAQVVLEGRVTAVAGEWYDLHMSAFDATAAVTPGNVSEVVIAAGHPPIPVGAHYTLFYLPLLLR